MENNTLNLVQDLTWVKTTSSNGNLGMNAKFTGTLKSIGTANPQKIETSGVIYYPATIDLYLQGTDISDLNAKVLKSVDCVVYQKNAFNADGTPRMHVGETYAGEITQGINADGTSKDSKPWVQLSHLTSIGNRIDKLVFGTPAPQVTQAQADLSQVS
tara:strand:+ start:219 stop:692 length:474 start_codon:yes stop_codon:yes gene_type:complete